MPADLAISVALATYNGERFLREQLESLAWQTRLPSELIVCDDGSTDRTLALVEEWAKTAPFPVHVHPNPTRLGFADNFLRAASLCAGDLIAFCDQDDVWLPEKLARCAQWFEADPDVALVSHNAWVTDEALSKLRLLHPQKRSTVYPRRQIRLFDTKFFGYALVFRRSLIERIPWQDRPQDYMLDAPMPHDHWIPFVAAALGSVVLDGRPLALYRQHGRNAFGTEWSAQSASHPGQADADTVSRRQEKLAAVCGTWADCLNRLAASAADSDSARLREAAARYQALSLRYGGRAALYQEHLALGARLGRLSALIADGGYRSRRGGGLGLRPLLRDLLAVCVGPRAGAVV